MSFWKRFITTSKDGENPAVILLSLFVGFLLAALVVWGVLGFPT